MKPVGSRGVDNTLLAGLTITVHAAAVVPLRGRHLGTQVRQRTENE